MFFVLYVSRATGHNEISTPAALGVLLTTLADFSEPYGERLRAMSLTAAVTAVSVLLGGLVSGYPVLHLVVGLSVAMLVGYAGAIGPRSALVGLFCLALFSFYSGDPIALGRAFTNAAWYFASGLLSAVIACAAWMFARYHPTRRKIGVGFRQLATAFTEGGTRRADLRVVSAVGVASASIVNSGASDKTQQWLEALLDEVEVSRVILCALAQSNARNMEAVAIGNVLAAASALGRQVERSLTWSHSTPRMREELSALKRMCESCVEPAVRALATKLLDSFSRTVKLLTCRWPIGQHACPTKEGGRGIAGLAGLRQHLHWRDIHVRHALKFGVTYTVGTALALGPLNEMLDRHGFWIPLTVAWVCKPDVAGSISRFSMRLCGTVFGVLLGAVLLHFITQPVPLMILTGLGAFVMCATLFANYSLTVVGVTVLVLSLSATMGGYTEELADARMIATLLGCGLVLLSAYIMQVRSGTAALGHLASMSGRLRESLQQAFDKESTAVRSPWCMAVQRDRLAAVAAIAVADAEPPAPWERNAIGVELRALGAVLVDLEGLSARLSLIQLLGEDEAQAAGTRAQMKQYLSVLDLRLAALAQPANSITGAGLEPPAMR